MLKKIIIKNKNLERLYYFLNKFLFINFNSLFRLYLFKRC